MTKTVKELVMAAEEAAGWVEGLTLPNELNPSLHRLQAAINGVKAEEKASIRTGYLHLIEHADGRMRITATVETAENYFSRAGWKSAGVEATITYSEEVNDLKWARDDLRVLLPDERWGGQGMEWSESAKEDLVAAMRTVAESVNNHRS
jgi:hypothetical protein